MGITGGLHNKTVTINIVLRFLSFTIDFHLMKAKMSQLSNTSLFKTQQVKCQYSFIENWMINRRFFWNFKTGFINLNP